MATIEKNYTTAAIKPILKDAAYSILITKFIMDWEQKFEDDVKIILHLDQWNEISDYKHKPPKISDDQKNIQVYYQIGGISDKKKKPTITWDSPGAVIESLTRIFNKLPRRKPE